MDAEEAALFQEVRDGSVSLQTALQYLIHRRYQRHLWKDFFVRRPWEEVP